MFSKLAKSATVAALVGACLAGTAAQAYETGDWVVRAGFYIVRYLGHKWENKSVVRQQEKEILTE